MAGSCKIMPSTLEDRHQSVDDIEVRKENLKRETKDIDNQNGLVVGNMLSCSSSVESRNIQPVN